MSGEMYASTKTALIEDSRFIRDAAINRVRSSFGGVATAALPVMAYGEGGPELAPATTERIGVWGTGFGNWGSTDSDGNAASLDRTTGGFIVGADALVWENWRLGVLAGYSRTSFDVDDRSSSETATIIISASMAAHSGVISVSVPVQPIRGAISIPIAR